MKSKPRYVFDTNTIVSAFFFDQSTPSIALQQALEKGDLVLSIEAAEELADVFRREKFDRFAGRKIREEFLRALIQQSVFVEITETIQACRDADDNKFLELAVSGDASYLITGDEDLLILNPFREISILSPRQLLEIFSKSK